MAIITRDLHIRAGHVIGVIVFSSPTTINREFSAMGL
jgi:hypothetical protein